MFPGAARGHDGQVVRSGEDIAHDQTLPIARLLPALPHADRRGGGLGGSVVVFERADTLLGEALAGGDPRRREANSNFVFAHRSTRSR